MMPITGESSEPKGSFANNARRCGIERAAAMSENQFTIRSSYSSGARDSASTPPARMRWPRPARRLAMAESMDCIPEAQLRITVQPGTARPQPMRSAATRPMFTSSTEGAAQPRMTASRSLPAKGWRDSSTLPAAVAMSLAENGPGRLRDFRKGVRSPSMM